MPVALIIIDLLGFILIVLGFHLAFRQNAVRRWCAMLRHERHLSNQMTPLPEDDPVRYALRISGVMILAFGTAISLLFTLAYFTNV